MPYATPKNYEDWAEDGTTATVGQLRRAEIVVDELTVGVIYDIADPDTATAFMEATCAQAAWFLDTGDTSGALGVLGSARIGSVSLGSGVGSSNSRVGETRYAPEAISVLRAAGLLTRTVISR